MTSLKRSLGRASVMVFAVASIHCRAVDPVGSKHQADTTAPPSFSVDGTVTVVSSIPPAPPPSPTCPGATLPDVCGSWEGVELLATKTYKPTESHDAQHCFCRPIAFQIPAYLPVTRGAPGVHKSTFTYRDANTQQMVSCRYDGDGHGGSSGSRYVLNSCSNGATALSNATGDYFTLSIDMGDVQNGTTEVQLKIGAPDAPNQVQDFVSTDPRLAGAVLHVPRGAAPPFQDFSLSLANAVGTGEIIGNNGDGATTVGRTVGFVANSFTGTFYFSPAPTCARVEIPYDQSTLQTVSNGVGPTAMGARQVLDPSLVGDPNATSLARLNADLVVDTTNHTVSFCVQHLSYYVGVVGGLSASAVDMTINGESGRTKMHPDETYNVILNMKNLGTTSWPVGGNIRMGYRTAANPNAPSPWRDSGGSTVTRVSNLLAPANQNDGASFVTQIRAPAAPGIYEFSWCMVQDPTPTWFGECIDVMISVQFETCNGVDDDGEGGIDDG
ncbi:MAG: hypothetical protein JWM53_1021, partial [bacterium]|nr:hypothetical protein [bacterium]